MTAAPSPAAITHRDRLPPGFAEVGDLLGMAPLMALLERHGGTRLHIPQAAHEGHPLTGLLGAEAARILVAQYGGDTIHVPLCKAWRAAMLRGEGLTYAAIARRLGMVEQSVYKLLRPADTAPPRGGTAQMGFRFGD